MSTTPSGSPLPLGRDELVEIGTMGEALEEIYSRSDEQPTLVKMYRQLFTKTLRELIQTYHELKEIRELVVGQINDRIIRRCTTSSECAGVSPPATGP